jgi:hypothetical protein
MSDTEAAGATVKVQFKSIKKRPTRRRSSEDNGETAEEEYNRDKYEETRELQKLRQVPRSSLEDRRLLFSRNLLFGTIALQETKIINP